MDVEGNDRGLLQDTAQHIIRGAEENLKKKRTQNSRWPAEIRKEPFSNTGQKICRFIQRTQFYQYGTFFLSGMYYFTGDTP
jgi:hypothetical protein